METYYDIDIKELKAIRKAEKLKYKRRIRRLKEDSSHWRVSSECNEAELKTYEKFANSVYKLLNSPNDFYKSFLHPVDDHKKAIERLKEVLKEFNKIKKENSKEILREGLRDVIQLDT